MLKVFYKLTQVTFLEQCVAHTQYSQCKCLLLLLADYLACSTGSINSSSCYFYKHTHTHLSYQNVSASYSTVLYWSHIPLCHVSSFSLGCPYIDPATKPYSSFFHISSISFYCYHHQVFKLKILLQLRNCYSCFQSSPMPIYRLQY